LRENTWMCPKGVEPQNPSQIWGPHQPSTHNRHREFDLDLKWGQRKFQKKSKNGKPVHGVMICDIIPWKNTKHGIPRYYRKNLHKKCHQGGFHLAF
jgi:hypothetical protein